LRGRSRDRLYFSDDLNLLLIEAQDEVPADEDEDRRAALARCVERLRQRDRDLLTECYGDKGGVNAAAARPGRAPQSGHNSQRRAERPNRGAPHPRGLGGGRAPDPRPAARPGVDGMNVSAQLRDLTDDSLSGLLDEAGWGEWGGLPRADAGARRYFVRYCALH